MLLSPIKISPVARRSSGGLTLQQIIDLFGFSNAWSSENLTIAGTTTTALDYKGVHNLTNPGATNQPTLTTNNVLIKNKPSLNFNTDDYLLKSFANWNNSETTGCVTFIAKTTTSTNIHALTSCDVGGGNGLNETQNGFDEIVFYLRGSTFLNLVQTTTSVDTSRFNIVTFYSNGVNYGCYINGISTALSVSNGANDGKWFSLMNNRDNISIGARVGSAINYATMDWFFSGYSNYTTTTEIEQLHSDLMNYLGL